MAWRRGDIVLIPFLFSNLSASKTRPPVVVSVPAYQTVQGEVLVAPLTSQTMNLHPTFDYLLVDWKAAGLLKPTLVKPRLAVVKANLVQYRVGVLSASESG